MAAQLPVANVVRTRLLWTWADGMIGSRVFWSYTGAYPLPVPTLSEFAAQVAVFWNDDLAGQVSENFALTSVLAQDLSPGTANEASWGGSYPGTNVNSAAPNQVCMNIEFNISSRYRGGHPRIMHPSAGQATIADPSHFTSTWTDNFAVAFRNFVSDVVTNGGGTELLPGANHVTVAYQRNKVILNPPEVFTVNSYSAKELMGSQRRRRTSVS